MSRAESAQHVTIRHPATRTLAIWGRLGLLWSVVLADETRAQVFTTNTEHAWVFTGDEVHAPLVLHVWAGRQR